MRVSAIIPVGPGHELVAADAIESALAQTYHDVECIVIDDTGTDISVPEGVVLLKSDARNVAYARNAGIGASTGNAFVCLDADDLLHEQFIQRTVQAYSDDKWVYVDCFLETEKGVLEQHVSKDWNVETLWRSGISFVTCLYPRDAWQVVGGFDETIGHEDWEFHLRLARADYQGVHVREPLVTYRRWLSQRSSTQSTDKSKRVIRDRYLLADLVSEKVSKDEEWPVLVYTGESERELIINGRELSYKIDKDHKVVSVHPTDVPYFMGTGTFRAAQRGELKPMNAGNLLRDLSLGSPL